MLTQGLVIWYVFITFSPLSPTRRFPMKRFPIPIPTPEPIPLSNQIRIFPFNDRNSDGVRQADEEILTGTRYRVSGPGDSATP